MEFATLIREGNGSELVSAIRGAPRALVFISVPWSGPERQGRVEFRAAVAILQEKHSALDISFFRLEVDEDEISQEWLTSIGHPDTTTGYGTLLWLDCGHVVAKEISAISLRTYGIVVRSKSLWGERSASGGKIDETNE